MIDVDRLVDQLQRATDIVDELDRRLRRTRIQVEELVPRLEAIGRNRHRVEVIEVDIDEDRRVRDDGPPPPTKPPRPLLISRSSVPGPSPEPGSVDVALPARPVRLAELALEHLARRVPGQDVDEVDRGGALVVGQSGAGGGDDVDGQPFVVLRGARTLTTMALTVSPQRSSGTPMTAASATAGWARSAFSTSAG